MSKQKTSPAPVLSAALFLLSACTMQSVENNGGSDKEKQAAQAKLERMLEEKRRREVLQSEQARVEEEKAARLAAEAAKPHYDPARLKIARNWRQWEDITIPDLNIKCWLKSNWKDGVMHVRLALLGDKTALRLFSGNWKYFRLTFANQGGANIHQCIIATQDMHWDESGLRNSGVPTLDFEGDSEVALEDYESMVQWNFKWDNEL